MSEYFKDIPEYHIEKILELIEELIEFYHDDDWLVVKKYLLRHTHPKIRKNFSTRHPKSKKHTLNKFEIELLKYCQEKFEVSLKLKEENTHYEEI